MKTMYWSKKQVRFADGRGGNFELRGWKIKENAKSFCRRHGVEFVDWEENTKRILSRGK